MKVPLLWLIIFNLVLILIILVQSYIYSFKVNQGIIGTSKLFDERYTIFEMIKNVSETFTVYRNYTFYIYFLILAINIIYYIYFIYDIKRGKLSKNNLLIEKQNTVINIIIYLLIIIYNNLFGDFLFPKLKNHPLIEKYGRYIITPFSIVLYTLTILYIINTYSLSIHRISKKITRKIFRRFKLNWIKL